MEEIEGHTFMNIHGGDTPESFAQLWRQGWLPTTSSLLTEPNFVQQQGWDKSEASEVLTQSVKFKRVPKTSPVKIIL